MLYYSLPLVGHFSFADMKIDNAVFFMGSMAFFTLFLGLFPADDRPGPAPDAPDPDAPAVAGQWKYMALAGVLAGFAFAFKVTSIMVIMALGAVLAGVLLHWWAAAGAVLLSGFVFANMGGRDLGSIITRFAGLAQPQQALMIFLTVSSLLGAACIVYAFYLRRQNLRPFLTGAGCFAAGILVVVLPWVVHNNWLSGNFPPSLMLGAPNNLSPVITHGTPEPSKYAQDVRGLPPELQPDPKHPTTLDNSGRTVGAKQTLDFMKENYTLEELLPKAYWHEGTPFMSLETLREAKVQLGREKDLHDIQLIDEYLVSSRSSIGIQS